MGQSVPETPPATHRDYVEASLTYLARMDEKPYSYTYRQPEGAAMTNRVNEKHTIPIRDARAIAGKITLDREGFAFVRSRSEVRNFYDDAEVIAVYYPECARVLEEATGAVRVVVFDHIVRNAARSRAGEKAIKEPARVAHNDYTLGSGPQRVRDFFGDDAEALLRSRFEIVNVWRPLSLVQESPLAICDARTIDLEDFVASDLIYPHRRGEIMSISFSPKHRWFYFSAMQPDEAILLKCYDSADDGRARFTAHTAFNDPTAPPDAPARESIETRCFVFFAPEARDAKPVTGKVV